MKKRLKRWKLKLLPDTNKVSGWYIEQFVKEKGKSKEIIINENINYKKTYHWWKNLFNTQKK